MIYKYITVAIISAALGSIGSSYFAQQGSNTKEMPLISSSGSSCQASANTSGATALAAYKEASPEIAVWNLKQRLLFLDELQRGDCQNSLSDINTERLVTTLRLMRSYKLAGKGPQSEQALAEATDIAKSKLSFNAEASSKKALLHYLAKADGKKVEEKPKEPVSTKIEEEVEKSLAIESEQELPTSPISDEPLSGTDSH